MLLEFEFPQDDRVEKEALTLLETGIQVSILCPTFSNKPVHEIYKNIHIHRFGVNKNLFKKFLGLCQLFPFYHNLWRGHINHLLRKKNFEILHIHDLPLCKLGAHYKKQHNMIFIADMHENYPAMVSGQEHIVKFPNRYLISVKKWYALEKKWLQPADHIICTAPGMIERLKTILGTEKSFALVPNTIHPEEFAASQKPDPAIEKKYEGQFVILYYGGISRQRGIQVLIDAIPLLANKIPKLKMVIVGDGSYLHVLKKQAKEKNVTPYVDFEGWQPQSRLGAYLKKTSVAVIPHLKSEHTDNTSPNKIFMFMYYGKPVLASDCNYMVDVIEDTQSGLIFKSGNVTDLARQILRLYEDPELKSRLGEKAKKNLLGKYQWNSTVEPLRKIYQLYL